MSASLLLQVVLSTKDWTNDVYNTWTIHVDVTCYTYLASHKRIRETSAVLMPTSEGKTTKISQVREDWLDINSPILFFGWSTPFI